VCEEHARIEFKCQVLNGNTRPLRLFRRGASYPIKPDIYFKRGDAVLAVADAKYKPDFSEQDRYEVLAYCEATGATRAALILPKLGSTPSEAYVGTTTGGVNLSVIRVNLAADDMREEERLLVGRVSRLLLDPPSPEVSDAA
jgi:5-methylcytosine-specific restriction enzyme subunit McrC